MHRANILKYGDDGKTTDEGETAEERKLCMHEICTCIKARD